MRETKMPKGTYTLPTKEGLLTLVTILITATLIEMDAWIILIILSSVISLIMAILCIMFCYSRQIAYIRKRLFKKEKTLD